MWIVAIAWMYVAVMMTVAEATHPQGSILGAIITFVFYGLAPIAIVMYIMGTPARRRARRAAEAAALAVAAATATASEAAEAEAAPPAASDAHDGGSLSAGGPVAPEGKETRGV